MAAPSFSMAIIDGIAKLGDKNTVLEGVQVFESLFADADGQARVAMYCHILKWKDASVVKQESVTQAAAALVQNMFCEVSAWSGGHVLLLWRTLFLLRPSLR